MTVLVYSDDVDTREQVKMASAAGPAPDLPRVEWLECATEPAVIAALDEGGVDVAILDGEATPAGGMGIARQAKDEIYQCPPILVLTGRRAGQLAGRPGRGPTPRCPTRSTRSCSRRPWPT